MKKCLWGVVVAFSACIVIGDPAPCAAETVPAELVSADSTTTTLTLDGEAITDTDLLHLKGLTSLHTLTISGTRITNAGLVHLNSLTTLKTLKLTYNNEITDAGLAHLSGLISLRELELEGEPVTTDSGLEHLKGLKSLERLTLLGGQDHFMKVTDRGVEHLKSLPQLKEFAIFGCAPKVTDAGVGFLKSLSHLKVLNVSCTGVTEAGVAALRRALPAIQVHPLNNREVHRPDSLIPDRGLVKTPP